MKYLKICFYSKVTDPNTKALDICLFKTKIHNNSHFLLTVCFVVDLLSLKVKKTNKYCVQ